MNLQKELNEWIWLYCQNLKTDFENLPESAILEIIQFLKKDGFKEKQINKQINNLNK